MQTFIMLTRLAHGSLGSPDALEKLEGEVMQRVRAECPKVEWSQSYAVLGPWDYVDVFRAPDVDTATKVSTILRTYGHANTEVWGATEWPRFKDMVHELPAVAA